jgi:hypothetical protein
MARWSVGSRPSWSSRRLKRIRFRFSRGCVRNTKSTIKLKSPMRRSDAAVKLSNRYISGKFQPDKAIDLIDEAGSRAHLSTYTRPEEFSRNRGAQDHRNCSRRKKAVKNQAFETAAQLRDEIKAEKEKLADLQKEWEETAKSEDHAERPTMLRPVLSKMTGIPLFRLEEKPNPSGCFAWKRSCKQANRRPGRSDRDDLQRRFAAPAPGLAIRAARLARSCSSARPVSVKPNWPAPG